MLKQDLSGEEVVIFSRILRDIGEKMVDENSRGMKGMIYKISPMCHSAIVSHLYYLLRDAGVVKEYVVNYEMEFLSAEFKLSWSHTK